VAHQLKCTRRRAFAILANSIVGLALLSSCNPIGKLLYKGDGTFSDRSEFNRPRYIIRFNKIPVFQTGTYQFHFRGLPNEKMTLVLYVEGEPPRQDEDLRALKTVIEAALINNQGNDVCKSTRLPALNDPDSVWVLSGGGRGQPMFWHWQCHNFQAQRENRYELTIRVTRTDPLGEKIFVTPTLEGGGIEFP
jgi:hypothetical protein